ncbi:MAG: radical SAM protein [Planctomycetales bacterium]|nr:radical SAM protein [Planctomycetales bacterium]
MDDRFAEKTTEHLRRLAESSPAIAKMYRLDPEHETLPADRHADHFLEKQLTATKGVVYKYPGRVLLLLSYTCAANCRYCERQDRVGVGLDEEGRLKPDEIERAVQFVADRNEINEVIFSGGDPLTHPHGLRAAATAMAAIPHVRILRIHTRYPLQLPGKVDFSLLRELAELPVVFYMSLHVDHPDELTPETEAVIERVRRLGFLLLCQTVFLKGVNDDVDSLQRLFVRLSELGVRPYYIYHCHPIASCMHFVMNLADEVAIMSVLRERLSGVACPQHIFEIRETTGKLVIPTSHWDVDWRQVRDYRGNTHDLHRAAMRADGVSRLPTERQTLNLS